MHLAEMKQGLPGFALIGGCEHEPVLVGVGRPQPGRAGRGPSTSQVPSAPVTNMRG